MGYGPKNLKEAKKYSYGQAHGMSRGPNYNPARCAASVSDGLPFPSFNQCCRKPGFGPDKIFCRQHDPEEIKKRESARMQAFARRADLSSARWEALALITDSIKGITKSWLKKRDALLKKIKAGR